MFETGIKPIGKGLIPLYYTTQFLNCILKGKLQKHRLSFPFFITPNDPL
jgi:hypothetical protein